MSMSDRDLLINQLNKVYKLLDKLDKPEKGTPLYRIIYELEEINIKLNIPFED